MQYETDRKLLEVRDFTSLVQYLRDDLDWPLDVEEIEDLTFEYEPEDLGLAPEHAVKVKEIKQLRPVVDRQPWGIFWVEFENRALPVTVMRQILRALVFKKRASARAADRKAWHLRDLMFMSSLGEKGKRRINFSYFREVEEGEPTLQTFFWDEQETQFYWLDRNHLERLRWPASTSDIDTWRRQWASAFTAAYREPIRTAKDLSERLAALAARTRGFVQDALRYERSDGPLHLLFESFQRVLLHDLDEAGFADMVAQTIAYGLFSARCTGQEVLGLAHLEAMVPNTNRFLKELLAGLARISGHKKGQINFDDLGLSEMVALLRDKNIEAVLEDFGRQAGGGKEDPVIHFYETFLGVYDRQQKVQRGVFYTPKPVVSFIVRSVHEILQKEFGLPDGLADTTSWGEMTERMPGLTIPKEAKPSEPFVQVLDPATGTGTFLEEVVEVIHGTMTAKWRKMGKNAAAIEASWNEYVPEHLLPRLRGFELMMAPYAVAHMKLGLKLRQTGYDFKSTERLRVYLTNALEPPEKGTRKLGFLPDFLSHESMQADAVKERKTITVIVGNPPYSGESANTGDWVHDLMRSRLRDGADSYFNVDGASLSERNPKWLNDDYVKFLRYGQSRIASSGAGVLGFITNHSYLDNMTFRGMRQSLITTFSKALLIDLHGNTKRKETTPTGEHDENVFDIQQGVAISLWRRSGHEVPNPYLQLDVWGDRQQKYTWLLAHSASNAEAAPISPVSPNYLLKPRQTDIDDEYATALSLPEIFPTHSLGIATARDHLAVKWSPEQVWETVKRFSKLKPEHARAEFELGPDARDWKVELAQKDIADSGPSRRCIQPILYRPFDVRFTYFTGRSRGFHCMPRNEVMQHFLGAGNVGLIGARGVEVSREYDQVFCTRSVIQLHTLSLKEVNYVFPLFLHANGSQQPLIGGKSGKQVANLSSEFLEEIKAVGSLDERERDVTAFHYIYAVLHSRSYRRRYDEELKSGFARIPVTRVGPLFRQLAECGADLVALHLLEDRYPFASWNKHQSRSRPPFGNSQPKLCGRGLTSVVRGFPRLDGSRVFINDSRWFEPVPEEVWSFCIGGYQVCEKWLKDRRESDLSDEDVDHYRRIAAAIQRTIETMDQIEKTVNNHHGWPLPESSRLAAARSSSE
jgi:hypothetical protein